MSFIGAGAGLATGPASGLRFAQTRGRTNGSPVTGVNYPSPFFDIAHTYLPVTFKQMFKWCRYYFLTNPLINAVVFKLSEYPVTDIIIDHENSAVKKQWMEYFHDHLRFNAFRIEAGLDFHCYGNAFVSLGFPFKKYLHCTNCRFHDQAEKIRASWIFTNFQFRLTCPKCNYIGDATAKDVFFKNPSGIKTIRWNPEDIEVTYNDITGDHTYFYTIPATVRNDIVIGRKDVVEGVPQVFIQAMREQKGVIFSKDNFFHMRRPTLATQDRGWGIPLLLPVLKDAFYLQVMKKAQEAILVEHIVPLRVLFPQAGSGSSDPYCVSPETLVETPAGLLPASEVRPGGYLRSHTGAWRRVQAVKARAVADKEAVFRVKVASLPSFPFVVSEDHPLLAVPCTTPGRSGRDRQVWTDPEFIPVKDLRVGDYVAYPVKRAQSSVAHVDLAAFTARASTERFVYRRLSQSAACIYEWLEENGDPSFAWGARARFLAEHGWNDADYAAAYAMRREGSVDRMPRCLPLDGAIACLVGYFLAEGSFRTGGLPTFAFNSNEQSLADEVERAAAALGFRGTSRHIREEQHCMDVVVEDVLLGDLLCGLCGRGFAGKRVPQLLSESTDRVVLEMLRCLFAGDGCDFQTTTDRVALKMANPSVVLEARRLLLSFGLIGGIAREVPEEGAISKATSYHLAYNGEQAAALRCLFLNGQRTSPTPWSKLGVIRDGYVLHRIAMLEVVTDVPTVIGFQMAGDRSFCVAGVATHNTSINLVDWRDQIAAEIGRWRTDNNYIPILPLPVGHQTIGGDGRALLLTQEIITWSEQILNGMGVPLEFIKGGMSFAGTNVSMRMMENMFLNIILRHRQLARYLMKQVAFFMGWPEATIRFKPFKMADDLQRKAFLFQLNQSGKVSDTTLLADSDFSQEDENEIMVRETDLRTEAAKKQQLAMAGIQGEAQLIMMKYQAKAQQTLQAATTAGAAPGEPGAPEGAVGAPPALPPGPPGQEQQGATAGGQAPPPGGASPANFLQDVSSQLSGEQRMNEGGGMNVDLTSFATMQAQSIVMLPDKMQEVALQNLALQSPELANMTRQVLAQLQGKQEKSTTNAVDQRPLPEQRPPRRAAGGV